MSRLDRTTTAPRVLDTTKLSMGSGVAGALGALAATLFMLGAPILRMPRVSIPAMIGKLMQGTGPDWVFAQAAGWLAFFVGLVAIAVGYGWMVKRVEPQSNALTALGFGLTPWAFTNLVLFPLVGLGAFGWHTHSPMFAIETAIMFGLYAVVMGLVLDATVERTAMPVIGLRESHV